MAVLSALIHEGDIEVLRVGYAVALELPDDRRWRYASALSSVAPNSERAELLEEWKMEERYQLTRRERNSIAFYDGKQEGKREGERAGQRAGRREGREEGEREGLRKGLVQLVLTILELRQIPIKRGTKAQIRACRDVELLELWATRARHVSSLDELFA